MIPKEDIMNIFSDLYDRWEKIERESLERGCGMRGSNGQLAGYTVDELFNELMRLIRMNNYIPGQQN